MLAGDGMDGCGVRPVGVMLCPIPCCLPTQKKKKKKNYEVNLH